MQIRKSDRSASMLVALLLALIATSSCGDRDAGPDPLSLTVNVRGRGISAIPVIIAKDQGLFEKHGLNVRLLLPPPNNEYGKEALTGIESWRYRLERRLGFESAEVDISFAGGVPQMLRSIQNAPAPHPINIGATDCTARLHIIGCKGFKIEHLEELAGMRLGASRIDTTTFFVSLLLADRMGWDLSRDIELVETNSLEALDAGTVYVVFAYERTYSRAIEEGYPIVHDTSEWNEVFAGNSIAVDPEWLENPANREAARRFLMAIAEAVAIYHQDRALSLRIMDEWNGLRGEYAERIYERGAWLPRKPYPCYTGYRKALELYGAPEMQAMGIISLPGIEKYSAEEFYDDSLMREIDATGFFDALYQ